MSAHDRPVRPTTATHSPLATPKVPEKPDTSTSGEGPVKPGESTSGEGPVKPGESTSGEGPVKPGESTSAEVPVKPGESTSGEGPVKPGESTSAEGPVKPDESTSAVLTAKDWRHIYLVIIAMAIMSNTLWAIGGFFACWTISRIPGRNVTDYDIKQVEQRFQETQELMKQEYETKLQSALDQLKTDSLKEQQVEQRFWETQKLMKQEYETKLQDMKVSNQQETDILKGEVGKCLGAFNRTVKNITQLKAETENANQRVNETRDTITSKLENTRAYVDQLKTDVENAGIEIQARKQETESLEKSVKETPLMMALYGYLTLETLGPLLFIVPAVEFLLLTFVYRFLTQSRSKDAPRPTETPVQRQMPKIDNSNSIAVICFRDKDEARADKWAQDLVQGTQDLRLERALVVNTVRDIDGIPPCRAALVFADPDDRNMIIEDERQHIGVDLRRQTVQRMLDSGVEVFIIIIRDKSSDALPAGQLYNTKLGQIDVHEQLQLFKRQKRIVSIKDTFKAWQKEHLLKQLGKIFP